MDCGAMHVYVISWGVCGAGVPLCVRRRSGWIAVCINTLVPPATTDVVIVIVLAPVSFEAATGGTATHGDCSHPFLATRWTPVSGMETTSILSAPDDLCPPTILRPRLVGTGSCLSYWTCRSPHLLTAVPNGAGTPPVDLRSGKGTPGNIARKYPTVLATEREDYSRVDSQAKDGAGQRLSSPSQVGFGISCCRDAGASWILFPSSKPGSTLVILIKQLRLDLS